MQPSSANHRAALRYRFAQKSPRRCNHPRIVTDSHNVPVAKTRKIKEPVSEFWRSVGLELRQARVRLGLTVSEFAEELGYSKAMMSQVENGINRMAADRLVEICQFLGIDINKVNHYKVPEKCPKCEGRGILSHDK